MPTSVTAPRPLSGWLLKSLRATQYLPAAAPKGLSGGALEPQTALPRAACSPAGCCSTRPPRLLGLDMPTTNRLTLVDGKGTSAAELGGGVVVPKIPKVGRRYVFGAPAFDPDRKNFLDLLRRQHAIPGEDQNFKDLDQFIDRIADRLTDKSAALLQNVSVFAGIFGLLLFASDTTPGGSAYASMVFFLVSAGLLSKNLAIFWPKLGLGTVEEAAQSVRMREDWRKATALVICRRAVRHTLALWILVPAITLSAWELSATPRSKLAAVVREACISQVFCEEASRDWIDRILPSPKVKPLAQTPKDAPVSDLAGSPPSSPSPTPRSPDHTVTTSSAHSLDDGQTPTEGDAADEEPESALPQQP
jgi:hypothetical protein